MRNIQIHLQTSPSEIDYAITAMQLLQDLKKEEPKVSMDIRFYSNLDDFTEKILYKSVTAIEDFFADSEEVNYEADGLSQREPINTEKKSDEFEVLEEYLDSDILSESDSGTLPDTDNGTDTDNCTDTDNDTDTDSDGLSDNNSEQFNSSELNDQFFHTYYHIPISHKQHHGLPIDKVVFGIYNEDEIKVDNDEIEMERIDLPLFMSSMLCSCIHVTPREGVSQTLLELIEDQREVPNTGGFEFDSEDSLKINLLLHLIALKVLSRRNVSVRDEKVYYRNLYIGDLSNTLYTLEELFPSYKTVVGDVNMDSFYNELLHRAVILSALTYCTYGEDPQEDEIHSLIANIYDSAQFEKLPELRKVYLKAEKERSEYQYNSYIEALQQEVIRYVQDLYDRIEEDNAQREARTGSVYEPSEEYRSEVVRCYNKIMDYAKSFNCDAMVWNYILTCYTKFLIENSMFREAFPYIRPWIQMNRKNLEIAVSPNYHCYYVAYIVMAELDLMDEFVKYATLYIDYCISDQTHDTLSGCIDAAITVTGYFIRLFDYYRALQYIQKAVDVFDQFEQEEGQDNNRRANVMSLYSHALMERGLYEKAKDGYNKVLELYYQSQEANTRDLSITYNNLGNCYNGLGDYEKAAECHIKAAQIIKELYGENDPSLYIIYCNIATSYYNCEEYEEGDRYGEKAQQVRKFNNLDHSIRYCR